jgi:predicted MFS family arabinose efflux permease
MVAVDTLFYTAIVPLVPLFAQELGLTKAEVGVLSGVFGAGAIAGSVLSAYLVGRIGVRPVAVAGLVTLSASSVAFGIGDGFWVLVLARLAAGVSSALSWGAAFAWLVSATPEEKRGRAIGALFGTAVFGAVAGPALGGLAGAIGIPPAFAAVAGVAVLVGFWAAVEPSPAPSAEASRPSIGTLRRSLFRAELTIGLWLVALGPLLLGVLVVLAPLGLDRLGWGAAAVGGTFFVAALAEAAAHPLLGRWSDEAGPRAPVRAGLVASTLALLALALVGGPWAGGPWLLALLVVLAGATFNATVTPGTALFSSGAEKAGADQGPIYGAVNFAWASGYAVGAPLAGALAGAAGDWAAYLAAAAVCLLTLIVTRRNFQR